MADTPQNETPSQEALSHEAQALLRIRRDIDRIDREIIALFIERLTFVEKVHQVKYSQGKKRVISMRPLREMQMLTPLLKEAGDAFSPHFIFRVWRSIICEALLNEGDFQLHISQPLADCVRAQLLIQTHFCNIPVFVHATSRDALAKTHNNPSHLTIISTDDPEVTGLLKTQQENTVAITGILPAMATTNKPELFIIGHWQNEGYGEYDVVLPQGQNLADGIESTPVWNLEINDHNFKLSTFRCWLDPHKLNTIGEYRTSDDVPFAIYPSPLILGDK